MTRSSPAAVTVHGLEHRYRNVTALAGVDLDVKRGTIIGLIGPDGVGKSTLLAIVAGARKIQHGSVEVLGGDMARARHRSAVCPRIAYVPQGLGKNLYATLSVEENLQFFGRLFAQGAEERAQRIAELLQATGLSPFATRQAGKLSGGMKQKLGLCCALMHDPELLILDEPTTGVDPLSRRQFWELIARIRARRPGMTVLVATAYFEEAERFDELLALDAGRVLAHDTPAGLKARTGRDTLEQAFVALLPEEKRDHQAAFESQSAGTPSDEVVIEAQHLTRRFGDFVAVDDVSFTIRRGEIFGFLGSNGSGKTTTMKMLTGLLDPSSGDASLLGRPVNARDVSSRRRVGFMSQSFSLYTELTVRQNLELHGRLFHLPAAHIAQRVRTLTAQFGLADHLDQLAESLPLGVRQRLSLAVAVIHEPELLILDEPTSGVDPVARDRFWALLLDLSRRQGVTIFISTHFMNEAQRCDRISLMHAGRVLTQGNPAAIVRAAGAASLEDAFVAMLSRADHAAATQPADAVPLAVRAHTTAPRRRFSFGRLWAYARREAIEIRRDPIRLAFALIGPIVLTLTFGFGISFDVENLSYAALDYDNSAQSRAYLENFSSSRYFHEQPRLTGPDDVERRLRAGKIKLAIEIPAGFGRALTQGRTPEVVVWLDGALPFRAEVSRGYVEGVHQLFLHELARDAGQTLAPAPVDVEVRFRYNQAFKSVYAMVPGILMMQLILIPAVMTALGVVREKELGSIVNFYVTPTTGLEFLLGKQLPYVGVALLNFASMIALALVVFGVPIKGSVLGLLIGGVLYVAGTTAYGLLVSNFVRTQIAAIFATAIITTLPAIQFSGLLLPVSSMARDAQWIGRVFPSTYFQHISVGTFTKALGLASVASDLLALTLCATAIVTLARLALRTQEK
jgi:ribosome-dependent ATPase